VSLVAVGLRGHVIIYKPVAEAAGEAIEVRGREYSHLYTGPHSRSHSKEGFGLPLLTIAGARRILAAGFCFVEGEVYAQVGRIEEVAHRGGGASAVHVRAE